MSTVSEAIRSYFSEYEEHHEDIQKLSHKKHWSPIPGLSVFTTVSVITYLLVRFGIWDTEADAISAAVFGGGMTGLVLLVVLNFVLEWEYGSLGRVKRKIYSLAHWWLKFSPPHPRPSDKEIIYYWLHQFWVTDGVELEENIEEFLSFMNGEYTHQDLEVQNHEIEELVVRLSQNPDYRPRIIKDQLETVLRHIIEFEAKTEVFGSRGQFIEYESDSEYLNRLVDDLNKSYRYEIDSTVFMLSRKFVENLIVKFYLDHFPNRKSHYNEDHNRFKSLGALKSQLNSDIDEFKTYTPLADQSLIETIGRVQEAGNEHVHHADVIFREQDMQNVKEDLEEIIEVFSELDRKIGNGEG